jgi:hypothetical protein
MQPDIFQSRLPDDGFPALDMGAHCIDADEGALGMRCRRRDQPEPVAASQIHQCEWFARDSRRYQAATLKLPVGPRWLEALVKTGRVGKICDIAV